MLHLNRLTHFFPTCFSLPPTHPHTGSLFEEYCALADYEAEDGSQVSFQSGDKVLVMSKDESGACSFHSEVMRKAKRAGCYNQGPCSYFQLRQDFRLERACHFQISVYEILKTHGLCKILSRMSRGFRPYDQDKMELYCTRFWDCTILMKIRKFQRFLLCLARPLHILC